MKTVIGAIMIVVSAIGAVCCAIATMIFRFQNPDMTEIRVIIENPIPSIIGCIFLVTALIGKVLVDRS